MSPALAGGFLNTGPPGKSQKKSEYSKNILIVELKMVFPKNVLIIKLGGHSSLIHLIPINKACPVPPTFQFPEP